MIISNLQTALQLENIVIMQTQYKTCTKAPPSPPAVAPALLAQRLVGRIWILLYQGDTNMTQT